MSVEVAKVNAYAVLGPPAGISVAKVNAYAVLTSGVTTQSYTQTVRGGMVMGGSSSIIGGNVQKYTQTVRGGMVLGGSPAICRKARQTVRGGMVMGGSSSISGQPKTQTQSYTQTVRGGLVLGGSSDVYGWSPMSVAVMPGSYRIGGVVYNLVGTITVPGLGLVAALARFPAAPTAGSGLCRYDILGVDASGAVHVSSGTPAATPVIPGTPAGQDLLGWVLLYPGMTAISLADIGKLFVEPTPTGITVSASLTTMTWAEPVSTITVTINDQNGQPLPGSYTIAPSFVRGNGWISPSTITTSASSSCMFVYTRGQTAEDESPIIQFTLGGLYPLIATLLITLLDSSGNVMM